MTVKVLTDQEYAKLMSKILVDAEVLPDHIVRLRQVHRLLCDGKTPEELTPVEQAYAAAFKDAVLVKIPNDYGWEPGAEVAEAPVEQPAPKANGKKKG